MRVLVTSCGALCSGASVNQKYEFIDAEYATGVAADTAPAPAISQMCDWLNVSRSGFYGWKTRPESATSARREELTLMITAAFEYSDGTYGYRRVHAQLLRWGVAVGLVRDLMSELGLVACQPRAVAAGDDSPGRRGPDPGSGESTRQRVDTGRKNGRRYHVYSDLGRMAISGHRDRLRDPQGRRVGHGRSLSNAVDYRSDRDGCPKSRPARRCGVSLRPGQQ